MQESQTKNAFGNVENQWMTREELKTIFHQSRSLRSKIPLNSIQQSIINELKLLEHHKEHFPSLDYLITENEIFIAQVMIFQKHAKKLIESNFHIDNEPVEVVQNYTYLGTLISSTGNFSLALDKLKEKALHALFSLRKHTNFSKLPPDQDKTRQDNFITFLQNTLLTDLAPQGAKASRGGPGIIK